MARKMQRMNLPDTTVGFDDPMASLAASHRRIEQKLAKLKALHAHIAAHGVDVEAAACAEALLRYFAGTAIRHHEDEERDLFPLLKRRIGDPGERERFVELARRLGDEHREIERVWARLRKSLESISEGFTRPLAETDVHAFATLYLRHIQAEDGPLEHWAGRWLTPADRDALGLAMAVRRRTLLLG